MSNTTAKPPTVLAIDDEPGILDIVKTVLEAEGYVVLTAANGPAGVELYKQHWRDIRAVLVDYMMPGMNGDAVFEQLRQINPAAPVLLVSGSADRARQSGMLTKGLRGVVHKPFYLDELIRQVAEVAQA